MRMQPLYRGRRMSSKSPPPNFKEFTRWVRNTVDVVSPTSQASSNLLAAAQATRDQAIKARMFAPRQGDIEVLRLLAAASSEERDQPPELMTAKGFRVTLAYDDGSGDKTPSICVLVQCPHELVKQVQGQTAYLWNGSERFELGQFDLDGKAIGTLPAGIEITLSDFATGNVKLEAPGSSSGG
jgi:hypothetical protein